MRRWLTVAKEEPNYPCPLTWGQEHDPLAVPAGRSEGLGDAGGRPVISVVFGNTLSDVGYVTEALRGAGASAAGGSRTAVMIRAFSDVSSLQEPLRTLARSEPRTMLVVDTRSRWERDLGGKWPANSAR